MEKPVLDKFVAYELDELFLVFNRRQDDLLSWQFCSPMELMFSTDPCLPAISRGRLNTVFMVPIKDEVDITVGQVGSETTLDIYNEISYCTICWPMYGP